MWAAPACSASPPLPRSCSSSDRSTGAPLRAETGTARARRRPAFAPAPPAARPGRARARRRPASSRGPRRARSQRPLPSPWILGGTGGSRCAWARQRKRTLQLKRRCVILLVYKQKGNKSFSLLFEQPDASGWDLGRHANLFKRPVCLSTTQEIRLRVFKYKLPFRPLFTLTTIQHGFMFVGSAPFPFSTISNIKCRLAKSTQRDFCQEKLRYKSIKRNLKTVINVDLSATKRRSNAAFTHFHQLVCNSVYKRWLAAIIKGEKIITLRYYTRAKSMLITLLNITS